MGHAYVLIEAWRAKSQPLTAFFDTLSSTAALDVQLTAFDGNGITDKMRECRHFMFHRDRRPYDDAGYLAPLGHLHDVLALCERFSAVFLEALDALKSAPAASSQPQS